VGTAAAVEGAVGAGTVAGAVAVSPAEGVVGRRSGCALPLLQGHESTLLALVADFAGVARGRPLRRGR
jgi:hypothetical protein